MNELIQKLLALGWEVGLYPNPNDKYFYLRRIFEVSKSNEVIYYTMQRPKDGKVFVEYEIIPNMHLAHWCIWKEGEPKWSARWDYDDYDEVLQLALEDRLFTYPK